MANPVWPAGLPQDLLIRGLREQPPETVIRTPMDTGPAKLRQRTTTNVRPISGSIKITRAERVTFDAFFHSTLSGGSLPFDWHHPHTQVAGTFRFLGQPAYIAEGKERIRVELRLELMP